MVSKRVESKRFEKAFRSLAADVYLETKNVLSQRGYWSGFENSRTRRSNGTIVRGANRDIVDTGELINSASFKVDSKGYFTTFEMSFSAPHYQYVRFGTRNMAGRDFVKRGFERATSHQNIDQAVLDRVRRFS